MFYNGKTDINKIDHYFYIDDILEEYGTDGNEIYKQKT